MAERAQYTRGRGEEGAVYGGRGSAVIGKGQCHGGGGGSGLHSYPPVIIHLI